MEDTNSKTEEKISFMTHMLNFDENTKNELSNITQYSLLAIIPLVGLNKLMKKYIPQVDEDKNSMEIIFEIILQALLLFFGLFYIHRFISFFSTYSKKDYPDISIVSIILAVSIIILSIQSKIGEKSNIIVERLHDLWTGETSLSRPEEKKKEIVKPKIQPKTPENHHVKQNIQPEQATQELPNYNMMYHNTAIPQNEEFQLMAANEALGGSSFGSMY